MPALTFSAEEQKAIDRVVELVAKSGNATYKWDHPDVADIIKYVNRTKVRGALAQDPYFIFIRSDLDTQQLSVGHVPGSPAATTTAPKPPKAAPAPAPEPVVPQPRPVKPVAVAPVKASIPTFRKHTYVTPKFHDDVVKAIRDSASLVICGVGPTGSGKTEHMRLLASQLDMELVLVNCRKDMDSAAFTGEKTVEPDAETKASVIKFLYGPIVRAMRAGLDKDNNEIEGGKPALLVLDEFPIIPSWLGMTLNNLLECTGERRRLVLPENGGEVVVGHSKFRIALLGNTIGRGTTMAQADYTAQGDALDISTLDRVGMVFNYGYSRKAENSVLMEKIGDDKVVAKVLKMRDALRAARKQQGLRTPFSTRLLVSLADNYRVFDGDIAKAFIYGVLNKTMPEEKAVYIEVFFQAFGTRIETLMNDPDMDYDY